jgi:hypothetical protein
MSLRTIAIWLSMVFFAHWANVMIGAWTAFVTLPLCIMAGRAAAALDRREGRLS